MSAATAQLSAPAREPRSTGAKSLWIVNSWWDQSLVIATPLLIVPVVLLLSSPWVGVQAETIAIVVTAFFALGHHLPGIIRAYGDRIHCAHIKGVQVSKGYTKNGRLGGHKPMGDKHNGWNFVTAGTARDATPVEELFVELNRVGFSGAVSIEWEDNDVEQHAGARTALTNVHRADQPPSMMRHDEQLKA